VSENEIIRWFLIGAIVVGVIVHLVWATRFVDVIAKQSDFLLLLRQGFSVRAAWRLSR
jgi:hypothetical protein